MRLTVHRMREGSPDQSPAPLRVAIVDRLVPLYREALYDLLMRRSDVRCTIVAAGRPIERMGAVPFPGNEGWRWVDAPCHIIPPTRGHCVWQWGAAKAGFSRDFDAVLMMANPNDPCNWLCAIGARLTGKHLVMWTHGLIRRDPPMRRWLRIAWYRLASAFAIYGHLGKVRMLEAGFDPARSHVCYNSLDYQHQERLRSRITPEHIAQTRREVFGDAAGPIILSLSRLNAFKKIDVLIRAHARLLRDCPQARLLIVGDGPERASLESLAASLDISGAVTLIGECYDEDRLSHLIAASDLAVTPGRIGLTVMHCLAYGVPCVTHDDELDQMPEFEAILAGRTGDFFRKDDVDDLARVMRRWIDPPRKPAVSRECIAHIERFYTPAVQSGVMLRALRREAANDLQVAFATPFMKATQH